MGTAVSKFDNLLMGDELGDLMNHIIGDMIPFIVRNQQREVAAAVEEMVIEFVNGEILQGMSWDELLQQILAFL